MPQFIGFPPTRVTEALMWNREEAIELQSPSAYHSLDSAL